MEQLECGELVRLLCWKYPPTELEVPQRLRGRGLLLGVMRAGMDTVEGARLRPVRLDIPYSQLIPRRIQPVTFSVNAEQLNWARLVTYVHMLALLCCT